MEEIVQKNIFGENLAFYLNNDDDDAVDKIIEFKIQFLKQKQKII